MQKFISKIIAVWLYASTLTVSNHHLSAKVSGTKTISGDYYSIATAIDDIMTNGMSGNVVLDLQQSY